MLCELYVKNFALIDDLRITFGDGLNVITGETGAGKSIIIGALATVLGEKTDPSILGSTSEKTLIEAVFDISQYNDIKKILCDIGFDNEDYLVLSRKINISGRSTSRINHRMANIQLVREITSQLIDMHGQHEHQSLLNQNAHEDIFDNYCGETALELKDKINRKYTKLSALKNKLDTLEKNASETARMLDIYRFELDEIEKASLKENEDEELFVERNRLANAEKLYSLASDIYEKLFCGEHSANENLGKAQGLCDRLVATDSSLNDFIECLHTAVAACEDASRTIRNYMELIEINPQRLEEVEARLSLISQLKRKYGKNIETIIAYGKDLREKIAFTQNTEKSSQDLCKKIDETKAMLLQLCNELSDIRKKNAPVFEKAIEQQLCDLAMDKSTFCVEITDKAPTSTGANDIAFLLSANVGEKPRPLVKIASGGEVSRIMLAIKSVAKSSVPTLVFDEIDAGIGGLTAISLAKKLATLGSCNQIICITHLAQIASYAAKHFSVTKQSDSTKTNITLTELDDKGKVCELTRMLGGEATSQSAALHAKEMLDIAHKRQNPTG